MIYILTKMELDVIRGALGSCVTSLGPTFDYVEMFYDADAVNDAIARIDEVIDGGAYELPENMEEYKKILL